ncbi:hypothetical protein WMY93_019017 [Mugilogobius chulae]|uniref:Bromo domain-containing protein n=1 Tax=Mugilogobius chulae TaxID=88201 RepID=A0AAW0NIJ8_9GOBI
MVMVGKDRGTGTKAQSRPRKGASSPAKTQPNARGMDLSSGLEVELTSSDSDDETSLSESELQQDERKAAVIRKSLRIQNAKLLCPLLGTRVCLEQSSDVEGERVNICICANFKPNVLSFNTKNSVRSVLKTVTDMKKKKRLAGSREGIIHPTDSQVSHINIQIKHRLATIKGPSETCGETQCLERADSPPSEQHVSLTDCVTVELPILGSLAQSRNYRLLLWGRYFQSDQEPSERGNVLVLSLCVTSDSRSRRRVLLQSLISSGRFTFEPLSAAHSSSVCVYSEPARSTPKPEEHDTSASTSLADTDLDNGEGEAAEVDQNSDCGQSLEAKTSRASSLYNAGANDLFKGTFRISASGPNVTRRGSFRPTPSPWINKADSGEDSDDSDLQSARARCRPLNLNLLGTQRDKLTSGAGLADIDPMAIDQTVGFDSIGGLSGHISALKEMVVFPLLYPEVFDNFKIQPPRGCLFYGPPGTGKTLVARALANECSQGSRKVAFFMRKGADCLSKWVGESERQLRLLFEQAYQMRPSIIFFDEIDGLAPVRSSRQDQIHSSIVSTLLALMDGLDSRGEVVVIGATNRLDSIDPALRRPGRFDREFLFGLPDRESRAEILKIHTRQWRPAPSDDFLQELAEKCVGYCGADIRAVCTEAALCALRRRYPQIYGTSQKLLLDVSSIAVTSADFVNAMRRMSPSAQRSNASAAKPLSSTVLPLLSAALQGALERVHRLFPHAEQAQRKREPALTAGLHDDGGDESIDGLSISASGKTRKFLHFARSVRLSQNPVPNLVPTLSQTYPNLSLTCPKPNSQTYPKPVPNLSKPVQTCPILSKPVQTCPNPVPKPVSNLSLTCPKPVPNLSRERGQAAHCSPTSLLLLGRPGSGQSSHLAPAVLHTLERFTVHSLETAVLFGVSSTTPEEACAQVFCEAKRTCPSVLYLPHLQQWWETAGGALRTSFLTLLSGIPSFSPVLLLATSSVPYKLLDPEIKMLFREEHGEVLTVRAPSHSERTDFFTDLILRQAAEAPPSSSTCTHTFTPAPPEPCTTNVAELILNKFLFPGRDPDQVNPELTSQNPKSSFVVQGSVLTLSLHLSHVTHSELKPVFVLSLSTNRDPPSGPAPPPRQLSEQERHRLEEQEEDVQRELRLFLRNITERLSLDRRFKSFTKPVDIEEVPDYMLVIKQPMDLSTLLTNIDKHNTSL